MNLDILILTQYDNSLGQMAKVILKSFNNDFNVKSAATESIGILDNDAVKTMKEIGKDISKKKPVMVDKYLNKDWDYVVIINNCGDENIPVFKGKVKQYVFMEFKDIIGTNGTKQYIKEEYAKERKKVYDDLFDFYLKDIKNKEMLGEDSCGQ